MGASAAGDDDGGGGGGPVLGKLFVHASPGGGTWPWRRSIVSPGDRSQRINQRDR